MKGIFNKMKSAINRANKRIKSRKLYIYIGVLTICLLTPISGDDYGNYVKGSQGLIEIINYTKEFYLTWEGRIVSRIILLLFTYHKFLWNVVTPFSFVLVFKSLSKINTFKNKYSYLLLMLAFLMVNSSMFAQNYTWLAGNITYFYPTVLLIYYFSYLYNNMDKKLNIKQVIWVSALAIIIPMFTENIGCAFVFGNFLFIIYKYYLNKEVKIDYLFLILSAVALVLMLISPGSSLRAKNVSYYFYKLSLLERIHINATNNLVKFTLTRNSFMMLLMLTCCNMYIINKARGKRISKIIACILFNIIPIYTILQQSLMNIVEIELLNWFITDKLCFWPYWILFIIVFFISLISSYKTDKKLLLFIILLILVALSSLVCMLVVEPWTDRISILFVVIMSFVSIGIIDREIQNDYSRNFKTFLKVFLGLYIFWIVFCMFGTYKIEKYRTRYVKEQKELNKENIEVIYNPSKHLWLSNLQEEYFVKTYKEYQKIDENSKLVIKKLSTKEYIEIIFCK